MHVCACEDFVMSGQRPRSLEPPPWREGGDMPPLALPSRVLPTLSSDSYFSAFPKREELESLVLFVKPTCGLYCQKRLSVGLYLGT